MKTFGTIMLAIVTGGWSLLVQGIVALVKKSKENKKLKKENTELKDTVQNMTLEEAKARREEISNEINQINQVFDQKREKKS